MTIAKQIASLSRQHPCNDFCRFMCMPSFVKGDAPQF
jgi:hypothetical protein